MAVSVGPIGASPLYTINPADGSLALLTISVEGKQLPALDAVKAADGTWYYLLSEGPKTLVSNLYQKKAGSSIKRLTSSATAKYNLSYDAQSGRLAYQSTSYATVTELATKQDWDLVVYDPYQKKEMKEGTGMNPVLLAGGQILTYRALAGIEATVVGSTVTTKVLAIDATAPYAIDPVSNTLAAYNTVTRSIDLYSLEHGTAVSYESSTILPNGTLVPSMLAYVQGELITTVSATKDTTYYLAFINVLHPKTPPIGVISKQPVIAQRIYSYE